MKLEGFIEFIKFINVYTHSERKEQEDFTKGMLRQIWVVDFRWKICMHQIFGVWNFIVTVKACVHYFYFCYQNKTFKKLSKMLFILTKNILLSSRLSNFCASLFSFFFHFLGHYWFNRRSWLIMNSKIYDIFMSLNWILKTQIL